MDDKERFDALMQLANFRREIREARRNIEWRVTLTTWAALGAASLSTIPRDVPQCYILIGALLVLIFHILWIAHHFRVHEEERLLMYYYKDRAEYLLLPAEITEPSRPTRDDFPKALQAPTYPVPLAEMITTLFLAAVLCGMALVHLRRSVM
jgi:hypothetical protein